MFDDDRVAPAARGYEEEVVPRHLWEYAQARPRYQVAAENLKRYLGEVLEQGGVTAIYNIESRAKDIDSYRRKSERIGQDGERKYPDPISGIQDCIAARVIVFEESAREDTKEVVRGNFILAEDSNPGQLKNNGYDSWHFIATGILRADVLGRFPELGEYIVERGALEIQVRTVAGHAWAEYEHDVRYKSDQAQNSVYSSLPDVRQREIDRLFIEAGGLRWYLDHTFDRIGKLLKSAEPGSAPAAYQAGESEDMAFVEAADGGDGAAILDLDQLQKFLAERYPSLPDGTPEGLAALLGRLSRLDITTEEHLRSILESVDSDRVATLMEYRLTPSRVRRINDDLLAALGDAYVQSAAGSVTHKNFGLRLPRVQGKFSIYRIAGAGADRSEAVYTGAAVLRELVEIVAERLGPAAAVLEGVVSATGEGVGTRAKQVCGGELWVNSNMDRFGIDRALVELLGRISDSEIQVTRGGELLRG
ncbi:GTP pyrophosphokinase [Nocardia asteroides]|uniref:GTP pyrophosphokinase n=1 Tax=Nocardia asteroides TaxID=1824 RepID=UPI003445792D